MSTLNVGRANLTNGMKLPEYSTAGLPASGTNGQLVYDTTAGKVKMWVGSDWSTIGASGLGSGSGGTVTTDGRYRVHTFTGAGNFTVNTAGVYEYFIVGGGAAGGSRHAGGGGAGGVLVGQVALAVGNYAISIGSGGTTTATDAARGGNGSGTDFAGITAYGGGGGGVWTSFPDGGDGACGGGASGGSTNGNTYREVGGRPRDGQGTGGGTGVRYLSDDTNAHVGGGGGGAGFSGRDGYDTNSVVSSGNGGDGILGWDGYWYAGGGGGGVYQGNPIAGNGGRGGGGGGAQYTTNSKCGIGDTNGRNNGGNATANRGGAGGVNTGGGGGGNGGQSSNGGIGGNGGSGCVMIRYIYQ